MSHLCQKVHQILQEKHQNRLPFLAFLNTLNLKENIRNTHKKTFILSVPSQLYKERAEKRVLPLIQEELTDLIGNKDFEISIEIVKQKSPLFSVPSSNLKTLKPEKPLSTRKTPFNPLYTFKNFISGPSNQLALFSVKNIAQSPKNSPYSPLFIYGATGLGKTHLLNAMGHILQTHHTSICYLSAERFLHECVSAIRLNTMDSFREKYRKNCQILLIDDIQSIERGLASQEEFFHTFNAIRERGGLVVCTCDRLPKEITKLQTRLKTRLSGGLVVQVEAPDPETKIAILQQKSLQKGIRLPQEVLEFLSGRALDSVRELEESLNRIKMMCDLRNQKPSLSFVEKIFSNSIKPSNNAENILKQVAKAYCLTPSQITSPSRKKYILQARRKAVIEIRRQTHISITEIGQLFGGRSYATILNILKKQP